MKKSLFLGLLACVFGLCAPVVADDTSSSRPDLASPFFQKQFNSKRLYREAWEIDNSIKLSTIDQLEYIQANNPGLDEDMMAIVRQGTNLMKKMKFGLQDADMSKDSAAIRQNPSEVITKISDNASTEATPSEALAVIDLMEPTQRLMDKMLNEKKLTRKGYQINIDSF